MEKEQKSYIGFAKKIKPICYKSKFGFKRVVCVVAKTAKNKIINATIVVYK